MTTLLELIRLFLAFLKIGVVGFGGGYSMLSLIFEESKRFGITAAQFADLNALDMIVPGPIAVNAATYVGYLSSGFFGALSATLGVILPSFFIVTLVMIFLKRFRENRVLNGILLGIKPAAVGLVAAAAMSIASEVLTKDGAAASDILKAPLETLSLFLIAVFVITAVSNIKFKVNPILLTLLAGVAGAVFLK